MTIENPCGGCARYEPYGEDYVFGYCRNPMSPQFDKTVSRDNDTCEKFTHTKAQQNKPGWWSKPATGDLDAGVPNTTDHSKRGFIPK